MRLPDIGFIGFVFTLLVLSLVFYHLLDGFTAHIVLSLIPVFFVSQILLIDLVERIILKRANLKSRWFVFLMAPGTMLHELSHLLVIVFLGARVHKTSFFKPNPTTGTLGYVKYSQPSDKLSFLRDLLISLSPFFGCGLFLFAVNLFLGGRLLDLASSLSLNHLSDVLGSFVVLSTAFIEPLTTLDLHRLDSILIFYLQFVFAFGAASSSADFENTLKSAITHPLSLLLCVILLSALIYVSEHPPDFFGWGDELSQLIVFSLNLIFALLLVSQIVLILSLPLVYVTAKYLELKGRNKFIPPLLTLSCLAYFFYFVGRAEYLIVLLVFIASTLALRYRRLFFR